MTDTTYTDIKFNSNTYNLQDPNDMLKVENVGHTYTVLPLSEKKPVVTMRYDSIVIITNNIHHLYVVLQYKMKTTTIEELSSCEWNYNLWDIKITSDKKLPDWANILNCLLNLGEKFNKPLDIETLEKCVSLNDKRGWGGERPREVYYKLGFPLYTPKIKKQLKMSERLFECPFPICRINPERKAIVSGICNEVKCFTCGLKEGETNIFGNICNFEKGHFDPHINGGDVLAGNQCKWCNSFYKDKISWNAQTGKPTFNVYAILRDAPFGEVKKHLKTLGFTPDDLK